MIIIGTQEGDRVEIERISKIYIPDPCGHPYLDGGSYRNYFQARAHVSSGGFSGSITLYLELICFLDFLEELEVLHEKLTGTAEFNDGVGKLYIKVSGDGKGHIKIKGRVSRESTGGTELQFEIKTDQTNSPKTIKSVKDLLNDAKNDN